MRIMALVGLIVSAGAMPFPTQINLWASLSFFMNVNPMAVAHESGRHIMKNERNKQKKERRLYIESERNNSNVQHT